MQSDTIIGIVGAVVLVTVMVGVFAYEYSNAPAPATPDVDPESVEGKMAAFEAAYPGLGASDDIDGDTIPNYNDTDVDGDGIDNADDDEVAVHQSFSGTVAARTGNNNPAATSTFAIGEGHIGGTVTVTWSVTATPVGAPPDELTVTITGPGDVMCDNAANGIATCDLASASPGTYTIEVRHANVIAQAQDFEGEFHVQY